MGPAAMAKGDAFAFTAVAEAHSMSPMSLHLWKAGALVFTDISDGDTIALKGASANAEHLLARLGGHQSGVLGSEYRRFGAPQIDTLAEILFGDIPRARDS